MIDIGFDTQREVIFSSLDDYLSTYQLSATARAALTTGSSREFFRIDNMEVDPRLILADFSGLSVFDSISKLAQAHNMLYGFDVDKFFFLSKDKIS